MVLVCLQRAIQLGTIQRNEGENMSNQSNIFAKDGTAQGVAKQRLIETIANLRNAS